MPTIVVPVPATTAYRRTTRANERYMEERLWQRALNRLEGPAKPPPRKTRPRSFRSILAALRDGLGRHVDIIV
jgi:hypothetical protein